MCVYRLFSHFFRGSRRLLVPKLHINGELLVQSYSDDRSIRGLCDCAADVLAAEFSKLIRINRFCVVHVISAVLLTVTPVFIMATSLPILCNLIEFYPQDDQASSPSRLNLFAMYTYYCYIVALIHFCSFFQLGSVFKTTLAFIFVTVYGLISFIGLSNAFNRTQASELISKVDSVYSNTNSNSNTTNVIEDLFLNGYTRAKSEFAFSFYTTLFLKGFMRENYVVVLDLLLLLFLIWFNLWAILQ